MYSFNPKVVAVNVCGYTKEEGAKIEFHDKVVVCNCDSNSNERSGVIVNGDNTVTHFRSSSPQLFELKVSQDWPTVADRNNQKERIYFRDRNSFMEMELKNADGFDPEFIAGKIVLVGYLGIKFRMKLSTINKQELLL